MDNVEAIKALISSWYSTRAWAEKMLCNHLELENANDVLLSENRGNKKLGNTEWYFRTHGVGVDIYKPDNKGGIDFDFDKTDPDVWRLKGFLIKQLNDGKLTKKHYKNFLHNQELWITSFEKCIKET